MNCEWIKENLSDIIDGLLTPDHEKMVGAHLLVCEDCSELIEESKTDMLMLKSLRGDIAVPASLKLSITEALVQAKARKNPWKFFIPRLAPVAAAVLVSVLSINMLPDYLSSPKAAPETPELRLMAEDTRGGTGTPQNSIEVIDPQSDAMVKSLPESQTFTATSILDDATPRVSATASVDEAAKPSLWVTTSAVGSTLMLLWGAFVYKWYKKA